MQGYDGKVIIATHFYKHQAYLEYCSAMVATALALERLGVKFDIWFISGHFHMEVCVNDTLTKFFNNDEVTDIILVDSDESYEPEHLINLLLHKEEVVCGVYRTCEPLNINFPVMLKTDKDGSHIGKMLPNGNCLLEAERIPGGFLKISKSALRKWVATHPDDWFYSEGRKTYNFFTNKIIDHVFTGMDFCFTDSMRDCGITVWVDPMCKISHWGVSEYKGTLDAHLRLLKQTQESKGAFSVIKNMAKEIESRSAV